MSECGEHALEARRDGEHKLFVEWVWDNRPHVRILAAVVSSLLVEPPRWNERSDIEAVLDVVSRLAPEVEDALKRDFNKELEAEHG